MAQQRQQRFENQKRRHAKFGVGDHVFLSAQQVKRLEVVDP